MVESRVDAPGGGSGRSRWAGAGVILFLAAMALRPAIGDDVTLQSGIVLRGQADPVHGLTYRAARMAARPGANGALPEPFWRVDDGVRWYFVPARITQVEHREELAGVPTFDLPRTIRARRGGPDVIGSSTATPFDEYGRRSVTLQRNNSPWEIQQEINRVRPDYVEVNAINTEWGYGLDTRLIPDDVLQAMLHRASKSDSVDDRKAIIRFYLDARRYDEAVRELEQLVAEHPELKEWAEPQLPLIAEQKYRAAINEMQRRRAAGQHNLASLMATAALNAPVPADALLQCQEIANQYATARTNAGQVHLLLEQYESELPTDDAAALRPLRTALLEELHIENIDRLEPFLRSQHDKGLTPAQKLALAYSAWVVGPSYADVNLDVAKSLWQARFLVLEYIRTSDNALRREEFLGELQKLEGVTVERLAQLVPLLPYVFESAPPQPGEPRTYDFQLDDGLAVRYAVTLPAEYNPNHRYPAIVALRRSGMSLEDTLKWWAGDATTRGVAMNRGYIVIAPQFADEKADEYAYDVATHRRVLASLTHARKRFAIDSDRVFVAGHEIGGDATFDLALSHPDVFAGAAPFVGRMDRSSIFISSNGARLPWYIVTGERHAPAGTADPDAYARSLSAINKMVVSDRADVTYCEYKRRGFESYHEELPRLFDWMDAHRRQSLREVRDEWNIEVVSFNENRYYWVEAHDVPAKLLQPVNWSRPKPAPRPMTFSAKVGLENSMYVTVPGMQASVWLSPEFIDFDKRLKIRLKNENRLRVNGLIQPDPAALLEDFRQRGDRQRLFWAKVEL